LIIFADNMTWYATELLAHCNDRLLAAVTADARIAPYAYLIKDPITYRLNETDYEFRPPAGGLLVLRPFCDAGSHCAEWHDERFVDWTTLDGTGRELLTTPARLAAHAGEELEGALPPLPFLRYLDQLAVATNSDMAFFYCFMWGGDTEVEYRWSFGRREEASAVISPGVVSTVVSLGIDGTHEERELDLLSDTLAYLGAPLASPFCILHTRGFPWEQYRLPDAL
jgi:hypothetical protein